ncbi:MAG TPA: RyR domain-containing protein [Planctomycetaceae bacterium]|nr:RyR domain-containing protein [Planctomycetaceae bacterium]
MPDYVPQPIDTSAVKLPRALVRLKEKLAEHAHEVWSAGRLADGWTFGPKRDDAKKLHPCLVPYDDLPESEKDYDRRAAMETLKAILSLGYQIVPPEKPVKKAAKKKGG